MNYKSLRIKSLNVVYPEIQMNVVNSENQMKC